MERQQGRFLDTKQNYPYSVRVNWENDNRTTVWWNETCAVVLEVFGLPGHRFLYRPHLDYMEFEFASEKDATMCKLLLSDRL